MPLGISSLRKASSSSLVSKSEDRKPKIESRLKIEPKPKPEVKLKVKREPPSTYLASLIETNSPVKVSPKKTNIRIDDSLMSSPEASNNLNRAIMESPIVISKPRTNTALRTNGVAQLSLQAKMGLLPKSSLTGTSSKTVKQARKPI